MMKTTILLITLIFAISSNQDKKPVIYIIGDSTVKNGSGKGTDGLWGWGDLFYHYVDTSLVSIENRARGGRSSRTFREEGLWDNVLEKITPGDYVFIQFGHNDGGSPNTGRARGTLRGAGNDTIHVIMENSDEEKIIHTYGWYLREYIKEAKAKGAIPIIFSPVCRNMWDDGKVLRSNESYAKWAKEIASSENVVFVDLNDLSATQYEKIGRKVINDLFFMEDHTHTTFAGARLNALLVAQALDSIKKCPVQNYLTNVYKVNTK